VAILLICVFTLYHMGSYFIYVTLKHQNNLEWQSKFIQNDFDNSQLQAASIPISFPYQPDQTEYQIVDESVELNGVIYRIVKKRYAQDTLHIVYVNDHATKKIETDYKKWVKQLAQHDSQQTANNAQNLRILDHQYIRSEYSYRPLTIFFEQQSYVQYLQTEYVQTYLTVPVPPPKTILC